jgi:hypothetical protein
MRRLSLALGLLVVTAGACRGGDAQAAHVAKVVSAGGIVDSALSTEQRLRRFRATVAERPDTLRHASPSIDHLVGRWARALATRDTAALNAMVIDRAEFAWLYYPSARLALPPYEMPPALLWEQVLAQSDNGARKALRRLAGRTVQVLSIRCPAPPDSEGANTARQGCVARLRTGADTIPEGRYFGSIIERGGRFKFLGLSNAL